MNDHDPNDGAGGGVLRRAGHTLPWRDERLGDGGAGAPTVLFLNALGSDTSVWEPLLAHLPDLRALRYDLPGHGASRIEGAAPETVDALADDALAVLDAAGAGRVVLVGLSIGGLIAQAVAARAPERVAALVLTCTAARIGEPELWRARIQAVEEDGMARLADRTLERWFSGAFRESVGLGRWQAMVAATDPRGYVGCCRALGAADLGEPSARLTAPTLCIGCGADLSTPPEVVRALAETVPGADYAEIVGCGHIPPVEAPERLAALLAPVLSGPSGPVQ